MKLFDGISKTTRAKVGFVVFSLIGISLTLWVEYRFEFQQFKWLGIRTLIISLAVVQFGSLGKKFISRFRHRILLLIGVTLLLFGVNHLANTVNIYELQRFESVNSFCQGYTGICETVTELFNKLKLYRFVSLTPYFFSYLLLFLLGLVFAERIYKIVNSLFTLFDRIPAINFSKKQIRYQQAFYLLIIYLLSQQLINTASVIAKKSVRMVYTSNLEFEDRWEHVMGGRNSFGWIYRYSEFINEVTEDDSKIQVPPTAAPWEMEGNLHYIRWFIYPRTAVQANQQNLLNDEADYVMITQGVFGIPKKTYPDFNISAARIEKIILVDRTNLELTELQGEEFIPVNFQHQWGLIKLRKSDEI